MINGRIKALLCSPETGIKEIFRIFNDAVLHDLPSGIAIITDEIGAVAGTISDGDIRRAIIKNGTIDLKAVDCMEKDPILFSDQLSLGEIADLIPDELSRRRRRARKYLSKIVIVDKDKKPVRVLDYYQLWEQRVAMNRNLVVIGLGYVGLTMAAVMADAGFRVTGIEIDNERLNLLKKGENYIYEKGLTELIRKNINKNFLVSDTVPDEGDVYIISVGTPVKEGSEGDKQPIMTFLADACDRVGKVLKRGNLVILRSTVPIGTTRNFVKVKLEEISGLICGLDFHLSFAPERTAEGKALQELRGLPQIIGGYNKDSLEATAALFRDITPTIIRVDSLEAAEMAKLINNTFRDYIFAYSNQLAIIGSKFNINVVDVIKAANEGYPRDRVPMPSPGVGGPCLTKDPHIFASMADDYNFDSDIFIRGRLINESMHEHVAKTLLEELKKAKKEIAECKILICGLAFKGNPETGDVRNSSAIEVARLLLKETNNVFGYDPVARTEDIVSAGIKVVSIPEGFNDADAVLFLNNHRSFEKIDLQEMVEKMNVSPIVYDGWSLFRPEDILSVKPAVYMGLSFIRTSLEA